MKSRDSNFVVGYTIILYCLLKSAQNQLFSVVTVLLKIMFSSE